MGRVTQRRKVYRYVLDGSAAALEFPVRHREDVLAVEEPLEIRLGNLSYSVTMRTPGNDVELAAGFLVSEGVISRGNQFRSAIHCGGPGTGGPITGISVGAPTDGNTYNVLDVALAPGVVEEPAGAIGSSRTSTPGVPRSWVS